MPLIGILVLGSSLFSCKSAPPKDSQEDRATDNEVDGGHVFDGGQAFNPVVEESSKEPDGRLELAKLFHFEGVGGDDKAAARSRAILDELVLERPSDPMVQAYLGSAKMLYAARTLLFWKKNSLARAGLADLDRSVARCPDDAEIRFLRGVSCFHLPGWFHRGEQSEEDLLWVADRAEVEVESGRFAPSLAAAALFHAGLIHEDAGKPKEASEAFLRATAIAPQSLAGRDARDRLESGRS